MSKIANLAYLFMRKILFIYSTICICSIFFGQSNELLKLKTELKNPQQDTTKVKILQKMGDMIMDSDPDQAIRYFEEAVIIAKKANFTKSLGRSYTFIGEVHRRQNRFSDALRFFEKALELAKQKGSKLLQAICYTNVSTAYSGMGNWPAMAKYNILASKLFEEIKDTLGVAEITLFNSRYSFNAIWL